MDSVISGIELEFHKKRLKAVSNFFTKITNRKS